jgi:hypothetical protein
MLKAINDNATQRPMFIAVRLASVLVALVVANTSHAFQDDQTQAPLPTNPIVTNAHNTIVDFTAPVPGIVTVPATAIINPITISYSQTLDSGGSQLKSVNLWVKEGAQGTWFDTGLVMMDPAGSFQFAGLNGEGRYFFAIVAEDGAGNKSPDPTGDSTASTVYDNSPPVITLLGNNPVSILQGELYTDAGATAQDNIDGDLTSSITVTNSVNSNVSGAYAIAYNVSDKAGNAAVGVSRVVNVGSAFSLAITQPAQGNIGANPGPNAGTRYSPNTNVTFTYTADAAGKFEIDAWAGATAVSGIPTQAQVSMNADKSVTASVKRITGTVQIDVNPNNAAWAFTNPDGGKQAGAGDTTIQNVPTGLCSIAFQSLDGFKAPDDFNLTLAKVQTIKFTGNYTAMDSAVLSMPGNLEGKPGQTLDCPISIAGASGLNSYSLAVTFDSNVLDCTGVAGGSVTGTWPAPSRTIGVGSVSLSSTGPALGNVSGTIAVLKLRIKDTLKASATTALSFSSATLNGGAIENTTENGSLKVVLGGFLWGDVDKSATLDATDASKILQYIVGVLPSLPDAADGSSAEVVGDVSGESPSALGGLDAALIFQKLDGTLTTFPADKNGDGNGPDQAPAAVTPAKSFAESLAETAGSAERELTMPAAIQLQAGAQIVVPVRLNNAARLMTYFLDLDYDASFLEFVNASKGDLTNAWPEPIVGAGTPGQLSIIAAGASIPSGSGALVEITFRVKGAIASGQTAALNFADAKLNDGFFPCDFHTVEGTPIVKAVEPTRGSNAGGTVVVLTGTNLADVDSVRFGSADAIIVDSSRKATSLSVIAPAGTNVVDVSAAAFGTTSTLEDAFTYFIPEIQLDVESAPEVVAGQVLEIPVTLKNNGTPSAKNLTFTVAFDPTMFTIPPSTSGGPVVLGPAAIQAGATLQEPSVAKPGELTVSLAGATAFPNGELCSISLLAIGNLSDAVGVIYLKNPTVSSTANKSLETAVGVTGQN